MVFESVALCVVLFSHRVCRTLIAGPQSASCNPWIAVPFALKMWHVCRIVAHLAKSSTIPYLSASCTNPKANHKFKVQRMFLSKCSAHILQNGASYGKEIINMAKEAKSYQMNKLLVRSFLGEQHLSFPPIGSTIENIDDLENITEDNTLCLRNNNNWR